jgi:hypothetical protein
MHSVQALLCICYTHAAHNKNRNHSSASGIDTSRVWAVQWVGCVNEPYLSDKKNEDPVCKSSVPTTLMTHYVKCRLVSKV